MVSLGTLEVEILAIILEYVDDEHQPSTHSIAVTNRHIYNTSRLVAHRRKTLHFHDLDEIDGIVTQWLDNPEALRGIRHVIVSSSLPEAIHEDSVPQPDEVARWDPLVVFIEKAANLKTLVWKHQSTLPLEIITALEAHHPNLKLRVHNFCRRVPSADHTDAAEKALASSKLLTGISAKIWVNAFGYNRDFRECAFRRIVATAPNLTYASLQIDDPQMSGHRAGDQHKTDKFYARVATPNSSMRTLTLDGFPLSASTLNEWGKFVDLSALESIRILRGGRPSVDYFARALIVLPHIKSLSLNLRFNRRKEFIAAVENYVSLCPPLETLSLWSWVGTVKLETILKHGPSLESLALHEREEGSIGQSALSVEQVRSIREACPKLRDLTIDMRRESRKLDEEPRNNAIRDELALFGPQLNRIQVYIDLGIMSLVTGDYQRAPGDPDSDSDEEAEEEEQQEIEIEAQNPVTGENANSAPDGLPSMIKFKMIRPSKARYIEEYLKTMWIVIFGNRVTGSKHLDVKFGEWEQKVGIGSQGRVFGGYHALERSLKSFWTVRPSVRDDQPSDCIIKRHSLLDQGSG